MIIQTITEIINNIYDSPFRMDELTINAVESALQKKMENNKLYVFFTKNPIGRFSLWAIGGAIIVFIWRRKERSQGFNE